MFCRKCGIQLDDSTKFCPVCGESQIVSESTNVSTPPIEPIEIPATTEANSVVAVEIEPENYFEAETQIKEADKRFVGKNCAYCKTEIREYDEIAVCSMCETALHKGCWEENGGCATFGCTGKPEGTISCHVCGAEMVAEQSFCSKCGSVKAIHEPQVVPEIPQDNSTICVGCGSVLESQQKFCNNCGRQVMASIEKNVVNQSSINANNSSKGKFGKNKAIMIAAILAVVAIVAGVFINTSRIKAAEEYIEMVEDFSALCWSAGSDLEDVGNDIQEYWNKYIVTYGTKVYYMGHYMYSIDDAVSYALSDNSSKVSSIKSEYVLIKGLYSELKDVPRNNSELADIFEDVEDVYEAFEDMYTCVIEVSGNYTTYKSKFQSCDTALANALKYLDNNLE